METLYTYASSHGLDPEWSLAQAYLLWRLNRFTELTTLLDSLPCTFHSHSQYWLLRGLSLKHLSQNISEVVHCYEESFRLDDSRFDIAFNLANIYYEYNIGPCEKLYLHSLRLNPYNASCWYNYSKYLFDSARPDESFSALKHAILLAPDDVNIYINLGLLYYSAHRWKSAEHSFTLGISIDDSSYEAHLNLGSLLVSSRRIPEALNVLETAVHLSTPSSPTTNKALFNLGLCHLLQGKFDTGWRLYQNRFSSGFVPDSSFPSSGPIIESLHHLFSLNSSSIVVWAEQGLGDCIQFSRYLILLSNLGIKFDFYCHSSLVPLLDSWFIESISPKDLSTISSKIESRPHLPLLSCPLLFSTSLDSIPCSLPYFKQPTNCVIPQQLLIPEAPGGLSVGIAWASNPDNNRMYNNKSLPLHNLFAVLEPLVKLDLINVHSLQLGPDSHSLDQYIEPSRVFDWSSRIRDFSDTAHLISQLDLVISVDTSVAHLAASLNCPTWLLLSYESDFRWFTARHDSPWYPKIMRLFRQSCHGDWDTVVHDLQMAFNRLFLVNASELLLSD